MGDIRMVRITNNEVNGRPLVVALWRVTPRSWWRALRCALARSYDAAFEAASEMREYREGATIEPRKALDMHVAPGEVLTVRIG